ncbi:hypothetical protein FRACA_10096 [Frankia canadensis]|uniref:Uncharacterized protein n=1 Tax=Frankia canadensis TaxID=1836972 RepID=A0A2I2KI39_9ACTN|nr:hypothetical protein [Frankia canadensis]SNQ45337.1 hypothetical protein FRACA_10096 [Frankia canadensis]SOU52627.1 hypothetical protein FRACA_10096 [Frankia canadensis]
MANPAAVTAVQHALDVAGLALEQISTFDLYSCFPAAVSSRGGRRCYVRTMNTFSSVVTGMCSRS